MARGWESKSVEDQVQDHQESDGKARNKQLTHDQLDARRRKEVLLLSRARVQRDLQSSQDLRYREQLNRALTDLDAQLAELKDA